MSQLAKLTKITDLREIWKNEQRDFSKWLSEEENLKELSATIGIDIVLGELESAVGSFNVDLFATEEGTDRKIVIENQLADTDHDHLGKIITYAAGKSADVIIWIVKRARDEHRQAVEWLNRRMDADIGFFLIEIELWKIGDSLPAPRFNVVEKPNDWAKTIKTIEGLSDTRKLQYEFWQAFTEYAYNKPEFSSSFGRRKVKPQHWYNLAVGSSDCHIALTANTQKKRLGVEIYIRDNKDLFAKFLAEKDTITEFLGVHLEWIEAEKACRILTLSDGDIKKSPSTWNTLFDWFIAMALRFKSMVSKFYV